MQETTPAPGAPGRLLTRCRSQHTQPRRHERHRRGKPSHASSINVDPRLVVSRPSIASSRVSPSPRISPRYRVNASRLRQLGTPNALRLPNMTCTLSRLITHEIDALRHGPVAAVAGPQPGHRIRPAGMTISQPTTIGVSPEFIPRRHGGPAARPPGLLRGWRGVRFIPQPASAGIAQPAPNMTRPGRQNRSAESHDRRRQSAVADGASTGEG